MSTEKVDEESHWKDSRNKEDVVEEEEDEASTEDEPVAWNDVWNEVNKTKYHDLLINREGSITDIENYVSHTRTSRNSTGSANESATGTTESTTSYMDSNLIGNATGNTTPYHDPNQKPANSILAPYVNPSSTGGVPNIASNGVGQNSTTNMSVPSTTTTTTTTTDRKFLRDCYSFVALHTPLETKAKTLFFLFGLLPFIFQMIFLMLLLWSVMDQKRGTIGDNDNPDAETGIFARFIPANASPIVRCTQVASIAAYVLFPSSSLKDLVRAIQMFPRPSEVKVGDPVGCMRLSCVLRGVQGILAIFAALLLVITSDTVVDIILNFTAVNFISNLDEAAFSLALSGEFGPVLRIEAERITHKDLPSCMYKASKHVYYRIVVLLVSLILFGLMIFVIHGQMSNTKWTTEVLRVQFQEATGLRDYSGCFELNRDRSSMSFYRYSYNSREKGPRNSSFGYCREDRQWILFKGNNTSDPCDAKDDELARSSKTDTFDISTSFDESWVSSSNTPLDMFFFESGDNKELYCDSILGDGVCDEVLNQLGYNFDGGDCCAATCEQSNCGRKKLEAVFGGSSFAEVAFPYCEDEKMVPITIQLNGIISSRDFELSSYGITEESEYWDIYNVDPTDWRLMPEEKSYFSLECDNQTVLTVYVEDTMVNKSETVFVNDGASCTLIARNSTISEDSFDDDIIGSFDGDDLGDSFLPLINRIYFTSPIWLIDYTIFHGEKDDYEKVEILTQKSWEKETVTFKRIPECYFRKLGGLTDIASMYKNIGPSDEVVDWLVEIDTDNVMCEEEDKFEERYALTRVYFAVGVMALVSQENQCTWPSITCNQGKVETIKLSSKGIEGTIPSEIYWLQNLRKIEFDENRLTSLQSEIGGLSNLVDLHLDYNAITSVPTEIGELSRLELLYLGENRLTSLPTEVGELSNLTWLYLDYNGLAFVPSELGKLSTLERLYLAANQLTSIPSEIGKLSDLVELYLYSNSLTSLPSEIGQLSKLVGFDLDENYLTSIPSEIGELSNLNELYLYGNQLTSIPSEIKDISSLVELHLGENHLTSIPSEIGNLSNLVELSLDGNHLTFVPTEIGNLSNLVYLDLADNELTSLPSEIGKLSRLEYLYFAGNNYTDGGIPPQVLKLWTKIRFGG